MRTVLLLLVSLTLAHAGELHQAARVCHVDRMKQLLAQHPSVSEADENGMPPLHIAVDANKRACVFLLINAGADPKARDRQGRTAIEIAAQIPNQRDRAMIGYMLQNFVRDPSQGPAQLMPWSLEHSVPRRQTDVTKMLLEMGVDPNAPGKEGTTPLAEAALKGDLESVRALVERGARPNAISRSGTQPIHDAALGDNAEVIRMLVAKGADVNARTRDENQTPLHVAAAMGKMKAVEALVALGADLTLKDAKGQTPLDAAERVELSDVVAFLRRAGMPK
ncbi:ankyrin repeat domain-containing protein [Bryobacter aggregatus]|uniref:ankyrin repeat domain-containing protein n=1 Tax=Bryobacter aggregatus TaxID=360054 RepID=UPI0004E24872|nr:ankyrin repeat domain-containing protein [Bryobacter aggregatus]